MALPEMLSALRQLILDDIPVVDPFDARMADYRDRFPALSRLEIEDLAKMPRDRLALYTTSIFSAQSKMLQRNLQFTFALLGPAWAAVYDEELCSYGLVRKVHARYPWKSTDAWIVARNLILYLENSEKEVVKKEPAILDAARFECLTWEMRKSLNDLSLPNLVDFSELSEFSVDDLLALRVTPTSSMRYLSTKFDVASARRSFQRETTEALPEIPEEGVYQVGGRSRTFVVNWLPVSEQLFEVISNTALDNFHVSNLAEGFISGLPDGTPEEESFIKFVQMLVSLMEIGAIRLSRDRN